MKRKLLEKTQESLLVCDNKECDFSIPYTQNDEQFLVFYINKPCPKCGENLLTEKDYLHHKRLTRVINWLNRWFSWTMIFVSKKRWESRETISVHIHDGIKIKNEK